MASDDRRAAVSPCDKVLVFVGLVMTCELSTGHLGLHQRTVPKEMMGAQRVVIQWEGA